LAVAFTEPSFQTHRDLFLGWIMCIGKRTEYRVFQTIHASSVLLTLNFFEPCANSWAKTKYEPLSIGSYKLFICQKLNAPNFRR